MRTLLWFRGKDLRLADHLPLRSALERGGEIVPLFVLDPCFFAPRRARRIPHRIQFLLDSLQELAREIAQKGSRLVVVKGRSVEQVPALAREFRVDRVVAQRWTEPFGRERDRRIQEALHVPLELLEGELLLEPGSLRTTSGGPYRVFTPFFRAFLAQASISRPVPAPASLPPLPRGVAWPSEAIPRLEDLGLTRNESVVLGGEARGRKRLTRFLRTGVEHYETLRDRLDHAGTSRLSADLKFGTISARSVWDRVARADRGRGGDAFLRQLAWREFCHGLLWEWPELLYEPFHAGFRDFPYRDSEADWQAWARGNTGYPIVDASARQLLTEGYVHNRARMISASFLTKHLLLSHRRGEAHYLRYLVDGDWAQNNAGWQWSAGCGCDAQPYFRVFNPISQGQRFDPEGAYVRRWLPELEKLPSEYVHRPWQAPEAVQRRAQLRLGVDYPHPVVEHAFARNRFLTTASAHLAKQEGAKKA